MEKIINFGLGKLNNSEHIGFHSSVSSFIPTASPEKIGAETLADPYGQAIDAEQDLVHRGTGSSTTAEKDALEPERDDYCSYIISEILNAARSPNSAKRDAYTALAPVISPYKGLASRPKNQETADIKGMVLDLRAPALAPHIAAVGIATDIDALETINDSYDQWEKQTVLDKPAAADTAAKRKAIDKLYGQITQRAYAMAVLATAEQPNAEAKEFVSNVNNLIQRTKTLYNQRIAQLKADRTKKETGK
ncbi:MAG TPA: hypothetical protein DDZ96_06145 [Porphyromonadaceae bacterium]|jgi:hypothetical protein|nr:hypothetical protein [Porphyromonadaceae bacterium]